MVDLAPAQEESDGPFDIFFACDTPVDQVVLRSGHLPNGEFWDRIAQLLISTRAPAIADAVTFDSEGSAFCAFGPDLAALEELATLLSPVVHDDDAMADLLAEAERLGVDLGR